MSPVQGAIVINMSDDGNSNSSASRMRDLRNSGPNKFSQASVVRISLLTSLALHPRVADERDMEAAVNAFYCLEP